MEKIKWDPRNRDKNMVLANKKPTGVSALGPVEIPPCPKCSDRYRGECLAGTNVCFKCKDPNQKAQDCTLINTKGFQGLEIVNKTRKKEKLKCS